MTNATIDKISFTNDYHKFLSLPSFHAKMNVTRLQIIVPVYTRMVYANLFSLCCMNEEEMQFIKEGFTKKYSVIRHKLHDLRENSFTNNVHAQKFFSCS